MKHFLFVSWIVFALTLSACHDEDVFNVSVQYPSETVGDLLTVDAWENEFTINLASDGDWEVEKDSRFFTVTPMQGSGNAVLTVKVQENQGEERKEGCLSILFKGHDEKNQELYIEQKCTADYDGDMALPIGTSNKIYAIGYSYDATGEWASPNSVKIEIFDTKRLSDEGKHVVGPTQASLVENIITGNSISEMTNALALQAEVKGGFGKFKAEANSSFDMNHAKNTNYEYATTYFNLDVRTASFDTDLMTLCDEYMTDDAWYSINGVPRENKRTQKKKVTYPSTPEGFKNLVKYYGTHVILSSKLGGRVRYSMETDISKITSSYDVKAFAKASYEGAFISPSGSVDEKFKKSFEDNRQNVSIRLSVLGGDESKAKSLGSAEGFTKTNLDSWVQSVTAENMALVGFEKGSLVPLYELIDVTLTEDEDGVDGKTRKELLKQYINEGMAGDPDFSSYDCGTVTEFNVNDLNFKSSNTLVRDIVIDGQYIGQICNEYIPNINRDERVTVVYPVINNKARYNMGFFLGNNSHKPARVSWDGTNAIIEDYADYDFGAVTKLYLRGATISGSVPEGTTAYPGSVRDSYLQVFDSKYRLVKIFDNLWVGEDYHETKKQNGIPLGNNIREVDGRIDYNGALGPTTDILEPVGWRIPEEEDYLKIKNKLSANGITEIGKVFFSGGVLGFNVEYFPFSVESERYIAYITSTTGPRGYCHVRFYQNGGFQSGISAAMWCQVRFIKK